MNRIWFAPVVALVIPGTLLAADPDKGSSSQNKILQSTSPNQRYVFGQVSEYRRDQYMLDTQTGRLWKIAVRKPKKAGEVGSSDAGFEILDPIPYSGLFEDRLSTTPLSEK